MNARLPRPLRCTVRLLSFATVVGASVIDFLIHPANRRDLGGRARWLHRGCRRALRALGVSCIESRVAPANALIVANHLSYLDILVLSAASPTVFVAKREVRTWPMFGRLARMAGTRFIDRENRSDVVRVADELAAPLAAGVNVVLFLEGTSTDGARVLPFKSSLLESAVRQHWPVTPAALAYFVPNGHSVRDEVCWWGDMTLLPHLLNLFALPRIDARLAWGTAVDDSSQRKALAASLHARVVELHAGLRSASSPDTRNVEAPARLVGAIT